MYAIGAVKVKNQLKKIFPNADMSTIKNSRVNGVLDGASGFLVTDQGTVYINTGIGDYLRFNMGYEVCYRTAKDTKDFTGGQNNFCKLEDLANNIQRMMS